MTDPEKTPLQLAQELAEKLMPGLENGSIFRLIDLSIGVTPIPPGERSPDDKYEAFRQAIIALASGNKYDRDGIVEGIELLRQAQTAANNAHADVAALSRSRKEMTRTQDKMEVISLFATCVSAIMDKPDFVPPELHEDIREFHQNRDILSDGDKHSQRKALTNRLEECIRLRDAEAGGTDIQQTRTLFKQDAAREAGRADRILPIMIKVTKIARLLDIRMPPPSQTPELS